nr:unnamed protein product [Callosobruchus chinensis]
MVLKKADEVKVLELTVHIKHRYNSYIKNILKKTYLRLRSLYANKSVFNFKLRKKLYSSLIMSIFSYSDILYFPCLDAYTNCIK